MMRWKHKLFCLLTVFNVIHCVLTPTLLYTLETLWLEASIVIQHPLLALL